VVVLGGGGLFLMSLLPRGLSVEAYYACWGSSMTPSPLTGYHLQRLGVSVQGLGMSGEELFVRLRGRIALLRVRRDVHCSNWGFTAKFGVCCSGFTLDLFCASIFFPVNRFLISECITECMKGGSAVLPDHSDLMITRVARAGPHTLNPRPKTRNPEPCTLDPEP